MSALLMLAVAILATTSSRWAGRKVGKARAYWSRRLPLACRRCGRPVTPGQRWQVGHILDRALGGDDGIENQWPEHQRCNLSAGGRLGAAITNSRRARAARSMPPERRRGIRGV